MNGSPRGLVLIYGGMKLVIGVCLFVGCGVGKTTLAKVTDSVNPLLVAIIATILVITFLSGLSFFCPVC
jgi:TRAP-type C4-dicarboxylate transport system permease large subunit